MRPMLRKTLFTAMAALCCAVALLVTTTGRAAADVSPMTGTRCVFADGKNIICVSVYRGYAEATYDRNEGGQVWIDLFVGWPRGEALVYQGSVAAVGWRSGQAITGPYYGCYWSEVVIHGVGAFESGCLYTDAA